MSLRELAIKLGKNRKRSRNLSSNESRRMRLYGHRAERDLVKKLRNNEFKAVRVPVSAPSGEPLPDVFATKGNRIYAFEVKATSSDKVYFKLGQIEKLFSFLNMFDMYKERLAILACKFPYKWTFKIVDVKDDYVINSNEESTFSLDR